MEYLEILINNNKIFTLETIKENFINEFKYKNYVIKFRNLKKDKNGDGYFLETDIFKNKELIDYKKEFYAINWENFKTRFIYYLEKMEG